MSSSGYTPLPSEPPPAYAADDHSKDTSQSAVPPVMPPYPGVCIYVNEMK